MTNNSITQPIIDSWISGRKTRKASKGWISGNAVCCVHNGETPDKKGRGGFLLTDDGGIVWHCFNCNFKTSWKPGWSLSFKMRKLLGWMGLDESTIKRMVFDAIRVRDQIGYVEPDKEPIEVSFEPIALPEQALRLEKLLTFHALSDFENIPQDLTDIIEYAESRGLSGTQIGELYWTPEPVNKALKMNRRFIIPFTWENEIIGYTARSINNSNNMKYYNKMDSNYVFNVDKQLPEAKMVLVTEGPLDALVIGGIAVLGNELSETKCEIIERLNREVIVVPDRGKAGQKLVDVAIENGWNVSFPEWADDDVDDVNDAVVKYGKLYTFQHIMRHKYDTKLKIELMRKKY